MNISELLEYYKIAKDSTNIKRVEMLAKKLDVATESGDSDEVTKIDGELSKYGDASAININPINKKGV
tara:strand:- start:337 stop:540 length:204 start_codon:yes stop_codon:yes gene_type:complete